MSPDVSIHISIGSGGAVTSQGAVQGAAAGEAPPPMPLEELQAFGAQNIPAPLSPAELAAVATVLPAGPAPAPMAIETLRATTAVAGPEPQPLGALTGVGAAPTPRPPEEIGAAGAPPEPLALGQLGTPGGGKSSSKQ